MLRRIPAAALAAALVLALAAHAQDPKPADKDKEKGKTDPAAWAAFEAARLGTELWKQGNYEGCFRLYQGALIGLQPAVAGNPKLAAVVKDRLDRARDMDPIHGAGLLREALDEVIGNQPKRPAPADVKAPDPKEAKAPLWERIGGEKVVRAIVHDAVTAAAADPEVDFTRGGKYKPDAKGVEKLEQLLVEWISERTGGPLKYTGRDMKTAHKGMNITEAQFNAVAKHLIAAMQKHKVQLAQMAEVLDVVVGAKKDIVGQ